MRMHHRSLYTFLMSIPILLFVGSSSLDAQVMSRRMSDPLEVRGQAYYTEVLGQNRHGTYTRKYPQDEGTQFSILYRYDGSMRVRNERELDMRKDRTLLHTGMLNQTLFVVNSTYSPQSDLITVTARFLTPGLQDSTQNIFLFELEGSERYGPIRVAESQDESGLAFCIHQRLDTPQLHYFLFDAALQPVANHRSQLPETPAFELVDFSYRAPREGVATIKPKRGKDRDARQQLVINDFHTEKSLQYKLYKDSLYIAQPELCWHPGDSSFLLIGLYRQQGKDVYQGVFWEQVHAFRDSMSGRFVPFPDDLQEDINGVLSTLTGIRNLRLREAIPTADEHLVVVAEQVSVSSQTVSDFNVYNTAQSYTRYYYNFMDVITMSISPSNQLRWYNVLKKDQTSVNDAGYYSSIASFIYPNQIQFYYNDLYRKRSNLMKYVIYPNGRTDSEIVIRGAEFGGRFIPKEARQVSAYDLVMPAYDQKEGAYLMEIHHQPE